MDNIKSYADCPDFLREYLFYMKTIKGRSERTVNGYYIDLRTFLRYINIYNGYVPSDTPMNQIKIDNLKIDDIKKITLADIYEFLNYVLTQRGNSPASRSRKVSAIKSMFKYLTSKTNKLESDPTLELEVPKQKKSLPKYLTLEQCFELLKAVDGEFKERDYCIITLFLNCGMRLSELVGMNLNDITHNQVRLIGKGNKERIIYLNEACLSAIDKYLEYRNKHAIAKTDQNALFLSRNGKRLTARRVEQIVDENFVRAGLDNYGFSTHKLRHTAATIMYQNGGVDIRILQAILGHANLGTTEIYTHLSSTQLEQAANSTPLSHVKPSEKKDT